MRSAQRFELRRQPRKTRARTLGCGARRTQRVDLCGSVGEWRRLSARAHAAHPAASRAPRSDEFALRQRASVGTLRVAALWSWPPLAPAQRWRVSERRGDHWCGALHLGQRAIAHRQAARGLLVILRGSVKCSRELRLHVCRDVSDRERGSAARGVETRTFCCCSLSSSSLDAS